MSNKPRRRNGRYTAPRDRTVMPPRVPDHIRDFVMSDGFGNRFDRVEEPAEPPTPDGFVEALLDYVRCDLADESDLVAVECIRKLREAFVDLDRATGQRARAGGASWADIGSAAGMSADSARKLYGG